MSDSIDRALKRLALCHGTLMKATHRDILTALAADQFQLGYARGVLSEQQQDHGNEAGATDAKLG